MEIKRIENQISLLNKAYLTLEKPLENNKMSDLEKD
jgi:hypothetical protein